MFHSLKVWLDLTNLSPHSLPVKLLSTGKPKSALYMLSVAQSNCKATASTLLQQRKGHVLTQQTAKASQHEYYFAYNAAAACDQA